MLMDTNSLSVMALYLLYGHHQTKESVVSHQVLPLPPNSPGPGDTISTIDFFSIQEEVPSFTAHWVATNPHEDQRVDAWKDTKALIRRSQRPQTLRLTKIQGDNSLDSQFSQALWPNTHSSQRMNNYGLYPNPGYDLDSLEIVDGV